MASIFVRGRKPWNSAARCWMQVATVSFQGMKAVELVRAELATGGPPLRSATRERLRLGFLEEVNVN